MDMKIKNETVKLKNGSEGIRGFVAHIIIILKKLLEKEPIIFFELTEKCRNPEHKFFVNAENRLQKLGLAKSNGYIHQSIKDIVLSSANGKDLNLSLKSPYSVV